ncbi:hypothetical protein PGTUg99_031077 [Puccinia graminis f. sp. tritici]|uniref:Uncharacterized protein n=1 Tax=Puccinia graminis f. sp. tritici TaxID=56615 RepID=A0A5B0RG18_PUCGR|nr:hypothetical protein PGTUg99_031077 [Puccinia graminis f. sp. tritici]
MDKSDQPRPRNWEETKTRLHQAWRDSKNKAKTSYDEETKKFGLKDNINVEFVEKYHQRNKPGQKEAINKIEKDPFHRLFSPFLNLKGFDGAKDTPVEILHGFQLGIIRYLLRDFMSGLTDGNKRTLESHWRAFNTDSLNIPPLQALFMVNHYKSFIGKHTKKVIQAAPNMHHFQPSLNVTEVKGIQKLMGIDMSSKPIYPIVIKGEAPDQMMDKTPIPTHLKNVYPTAKWKLIRTIKTSKYDSVHQGIFVLIKRQDRSPYVAEVSKVWQANSQSSTIFLEVQEYKPVGLNGTYLMQEYVATNNLMYATAQHNCIEGLCKVITQTLKTEGKQEGTTTRKTIGHTPTNSYILNAFSLRSIQGHRNHSMLPRRPISQAMWDEAITRA